VKGVEEIVTNISSFFQTESPQLSPPDPTDSDIMGAHTSSVRINASQMPPLLVEGDTYKQLYDDLRAFFLSSKASTEKEDRGEEEIPILNCDTIVQLLKDNVDGVTGMMDRTGSIPVTQYIVSTYLSGLPLFESNNALKQHTIKAIRFVFFKASLLPQKSRRPLLRRLAEAFTACQMEQGRVIDSIYGSLSGRDKNFREQVLSLVDIQKEQVLNQIVNIFNPNAWRTGDDNPKGQVPHIQSSYCSVVGTRLGLRGVKAAKLDKDKFTINNDSSNTIIESFNRLFSIEELLKSFIADVNQQDLEAERLINRDSLLRWAGDSKINNGFDGHSIFYDEEKAERWHEDLGKPTAENFYQPFLNKEVALKILECLYLK